MKKITQFIVLSIAVFLMAGTAQAVVIDDFTEDSDYCLPNGTPPVVKTDVRTGTNQHIIGGQCDITFDKRTGTTSAPSVCFVSAGCNPPTYCWPANGQYASGSYTQKAVWGMEYGKQANLNADFIKGGGTSIRIEVSGDIYLSPVPCTITLISGKGTPQEATKSVTQNLTTLNGNDSNIITFFYSAFTGINFADVDYIKVEMSMLNMTAAIDYTINWIQTDNDPTAIDLTYFRAIPGNKQVILTWETATEIDTAGFNILRAEKKGDYIIINDEGLIPAAGSATQGMSYDYIDTTAQNGKRYWYKLQEVDLIERTQEFGPVEARPKKGL
jgi:hypothetical protein